MVLFEEVRVAKTKYDTYWGKCTLCHKGMGGRRFVPAIDTATETKQGTLVYDPHLAKRQFCTPCAKKLLKKWYHSVLRIN